MATKIKNKIPKAEILEREAKLIRHTKRASDYAYMAINYLGMAANTDDNAMRLKYLEFAKKMSRFAQSEMAELNGNSEFTNNVATHARGTRPLVDKAYFATLLPIDHAKLSNSTSI